MEIHHLGRINFFSWEFLLGFRGADCGVLGAEGAV